MEESEFNAATSLIKACLHQHGSYPCKVMEKLLMFVMSEEGMQIRPRTLRHLVVNLSQSIVYPHSRNVYLLHFKSLSDEVKVRLATNTMISQVLTTTDKERWEYLNILRAIHTVTDVRWFQTLEIMETHYELLKNGGNIDKCDFFVRKYCEQPPVELESSMEFEEYSCFPRLLNQLQFDTMRYYINNNMIEEARSLVGVIESPESQRRCFKTRILFYSRELDSEMAMEMLRNEYQHKCQRTDAWFELDLSEILMINNEFDKFKQQIEEIVKTSLSMETKMRENNTFVYLRTKDKFRRLFYQSKLHGRAYRFRFYLVKVLIENGLFESSIFELFRHEFFAFQIPASSPTMLLELCREARSNSMADFDDAFELCTSACYVRTIKQPRYPEKQSIYQPTKYYVRRLFSLALDNYIEQFYPDSYVFSVYNSAYEYNSLKKSYFFDISDDVRSQLQSRL